MERVNPDAKEHLHEVRQLLKEGRVQEAELLASRSMYASYPHMRHYQTLGDVWIDFFHTRGRQIVKKKENGTSFVEYEPPVFEGYRRRLNLEDAMGSIAYKTEKGSVKREFFASAPAQVLVYKMYADADREYLKKLPPRNAIPSGIPDESVPLYLQRLEYYRRLYRPKQVEGQ